jgi:fatty-acyl-CoA synthase
MQSTMQDVPLSLAMLLRHGLAVHGSSEVVTCLGEGSRRATFREVGERVGQLAHALARLGVSDGDRVATFQWNNQEHLEGYLAIPAMKAVLHTLNIRLFPEQLVYVANHAEDKVVIVDNSLVPLLARVLPDMKTVEHVLVVGDADTSVLSGPATIHSYEELLAAESPDYPWPDDIDERSAAAMCYTSGTTGNPKGVVYSHRSTYLHSMAVCTGENLGLTERDRLMPIVPMFHANAWGQPYAAWMAGADLLMPDRYLQGEPLSRFITEAKPTLTAGVPTIGSDLLRYAVEHRDSADLSSLRNMMMGGSAVPRSLIEAFESELGIEVVQGWGMTETSPVAAIARAPKDTPPEEELQWRAHTGRLVCGVECRIVGDDGQPLPRDGESVGEFEVRGPWITGAYYKGDDPSRFHEGWLRTGDVGTIDERGFMQITDRTKDVIKSGGEWISSVELENHLMAHPDVLEAAVVAVPDDRWQERPLASVVVREGATLDAEALRAFLADRVAKWQLPERWAFIPEVPKTSVGKFDKKVLRAKYAEGELDVTKLDGPGA